MTVLDQVEQGKSLEYLFRLKAVVRVTNWTLDTSVGPTTYRSPLIANFVDGVTLNGTIFTAHTSLSDFSVTTADRYFFDTNNQVIYADLTTYTPLDLDDYIYVDYEVNIGSKEVGFFRDPTDSGSPQTQYFPGLSNGFRLSSSVDGNIDGFLTSVTSTVDIVNVDYALSSLLLKSTIAKKSAFVYLVSDSFQVANVLKIFDGSVQSVSFDDSKISLSVLGKSFDFDASYGYRRTKTVGNPYNLDDFPLLAPSGVGRFERSVYGMINAVEGTNIDFDSEGATANNRVHRICSHFYDVGASDAAKKAASPLEFVVQTGSTTTTTFLDTVEELNIGDEMLTSSLDVLFFILDIDRGTNMVTHNVIGAPLTDSTVIKRDRVTSVLRIDKSIGTAILAQRDSTPPIGSIYYGVDFEDDGITIDASNSNLIGFAPNGSSNTTLLCRVYGENNRLEDDGENLYHRDNVRLSLQWHHVLYEYLRLEMGIPASAIDSASFAQFDSTPQKKVGLLIPETLSGQLPKHREILAPLLVGNFVSLYQNESGQIAITTVSKMTTPDTTITKDDIISISYSEDYLDLASKVVCVYRPGDVVGGFELDSLVTLSTMKKPASTEPGLVTNTFERAAISNAYGSTSIKTLTTAFYLEEDAEDFAEKSFYINGFPFQEFTVTLPVYFVSAKIGDVFKIERDDLPGGVTEVLARVFSVDFDGTKVTLRLWTQGGIQDSIGVW